MNITLERIQKSYRPQLQPPEWVLNQISLSIQSGERFFLLGPSGSGKTTLLRIVAGLLQPESGKVYFGPRLMNGVPPRNRHTAMVFQNYALWPHLSVFENVAYGPRAQGISGEPLTSRVRQALETVQMSAYAARLPGELSGGQQQRVALARALAVKPDVLLLDEPLSQLDARLRLELRSELLRIHAESPTTSIFVTHDQEEALALADRIAILHRGTIAQIGPPQELYEKPDSEFIARFMGEINLVNPESPLVISACGEHWPAEVKKIGIRPERVLMIGVASREDESPTRGSNPLKASQAAVPARVQSSLYLGSKYEITVKLIDGQLLKIWSPTPALADTIHIEVKSADLIAIMR